MFHTLCHASLLQSAGDGTPSKISVPSVWLTVTAIAVQVSNTFDFVFDIISARRLPDGSAAVLKRVLPSSEEEAARTAKHTGTGS